MLKSTITRWFAALVFATPGFVTAQQAITNSAVNLRAGPDSDYPRVRWLPEGTPVDVQGCLPDYRWCDVIIEDDRGWIHARYLSYPYQNEYAPVITYGAVIGLPILGFSIWSYWDDHYRRRPWYDDRSRWEDRRAYPPPPPNYRPPSYRPPQYGPPEYRPPLPRPPEFRPPQPRPPEVRPPRPPDVRPPEYRPPEIRPPRPSPPQFPAPGARPPQFRPPEARPPQGPPPVFQPPRPQQPSIQPPVARPPGPPPPGNGRPPSGRPPGDRSSGPPGGMTTGNF